MSNPETVIQLENDIVESDVCAGCGETAAEKGEPLLRPCACQGSHNLYHYGCLVQWIRGRQSIRCNRCNEQFRDPRIRTSPQTFKRWLFSWRVLTIVVVMAVVVCCLPIQGIIMHRLGSEGLQGYIFFSLFVMFIVFMGVLQLIGSYRKWRRDNELGFLEYETTNALGRRRTVAYGWTRDIRRANRERDLEAIVSSLRSERINNRDRNRDRFENLAYFLALLYVLTFPQGFGLPYGLLGPNRALTGEQSAETGNELMGRESDAAVDAAVRQLMADMLDIIDNQSQSNGSAENNE